MPDYFSEGQEVKTWDFRLELIFERFNSFVKRLKTVQEFCITANQFLKLEKVFILSYIAIKYSCFCIVWMIDVSSKIVLG